MSDSIPATAKLRILCLHGYRQNADSFRNKLGAFRKIAKKYADLAPLVVPSVQNLASPSVEPESLPEQAEQRGWWFSKKENSFNAHDKTEVCYGFDDSLDVVKDAIDKLGPFDGVLGFSQGAAMGALLCGLQQQNKISGQFKFAIFFAGFKSGSASHDEHYDALITCPSLHVIGQGDQIIPKEMCRQLSNHFKYPEILLHPGGHFIPASQQQKSTYVSFFEKMMAYCQL